MNGNGLSKFRVKQMNGTNTERRSSCADEDVRSKSEFPPGRTYIADEQMGYLQHCSLCRGVWSTGSLQPPLSRQGNRMHGAVCFSAPFCGWLWQRCSRSRKQMVAVNPRFVGTFSRPGHLCIVRA